ncbi:MAG: hypothetical protein C0403_13190 [Desulfobacterium sp.]|nr:hypothetical protein [Desulfobacterium sp.]
MALYKDFPSSRHIKFWSSRDFAEVLGYGEYRNFEGVIKKIRLSCFNSRHCIEDHFVDVTEMIEIGNGGHRPVKTVLMLRYAFRELGGTMPEDLPVVESIKKN